MSNQFQSIILKDLEEKNYKKLLIHWLNNYKLQYHWIKHLQNRELALIVPNWNIQEMKYSCRMIRSHNTQAFQIALKTHGIYDHQRITNVYYSLAEYEHGIPFNDNPQLTIKKSEWKEKHQTAIRSYDLVIDIDCNGLRDCNRQKINVQRILEGLKQYDPQLRFSGNGFHIIIPQGRTKLIGSYNPFEEGNIYKQYTNIAEYFHNHITDKIDLSIYDSRRVIKLPYTLSFYKKRNKGELRIMICYPFQSTEEFKNFKAENYEIKQFLTDHPNFPDGIQKT